MIGFINWSSRPLDLEMGWMSMEWQRLLERQWSACSPCSGKGRWDLESSSSSSRVVMLVCGGNVSDKDKRM